MMPAAVALLLANCTFAQEFQYAGETYFAANCYGHPQVVTPKDTLKTNFTAYALTLWMEDQIRSGETKHDDND